jgi:hypothetical protein
MRVWVDITDAAHTVFFAPIVRRLEDAGHVVTVTARRFAGADEVLRRYGLGGVLTTGHRGGGVGTRAVGLVNRTAQLLGSASSGRFDVAAGSHASDFVLAAWTLGIPQLTFLDDERARRGNRVNVRLVDEVAVPEVVRPETLQAFGAPREKLFRYPGFAEEYYLYDVRRDPGALARVFADPPGIVGVVRPPRASGVPTGPSCSPADDAGSRRPSATRAASTAEGGRRDTVYAGVPSAAASRAITPPAPRTKSAAASRLTASDSGPSGATRPRGTRARKRSRCAASRARRINETPLRPARSPTRSIRSASGCPAA